MALRLRQHSPSVLARRGARQGPPAGTDFGTTRWASGEHGPVEGGSMSHQTYRRIWHVVRQIPRGRVATYGQIAALAGFPNHARQVGYALHALPRGEDIPWQRVINAKGEVSARSEDGWQGYQRHLLEEEGISFDARGRVDLKRWRWQPEADVSGEPPEPAVPADDQSPA